MSKKNILGSSQKSLAAIVTRRVPPLVQKIASPRKRQWIVGFGPTVIPPKSQITISSQPRCLFRGHTLINTGDSDELFIQGLFVGRKSQLPLGSGPYPVAAYNNNKEIPSATIPFSLVLADFIKEKLGIQEVIKGMTMDTCDAALFITFQIQNTSGATATWSMSIVGETVL
jgi:hypothetical protein